MKACTTIEAYVEKFHGPVRALLEQMRDTIATAAPDAEECISYGIPTWKLNGNLVHMGGFAGHIGFYPGPAAIKAFAKDLAPYKRSKGAVQFPLDARLPVAVIRKIVKARVKEQRAKTKKRRSI